MGPGVELSARSRCPGSEKGSRRARGVSQRFCPPSPQGCHRAARVEDRGGQAVLGGERGVPPAEVLRSSAQHSKALRRPNICLSLLPIGERPGSTRGRSQGRRRRTARQPGRGQRVSNRAPRARARGPPGADAAGAIPANERDQARWTSPMWRSRAKGRPPKRGSASSGASSHCEQSLLHRVRSSTTPSCRPGTLSARRASLSRSPHASSRVCVSSKAITGAAEKNLGQHRFGYVGGL